MAIDLNERVLHDNKMDNCGMICHQWYCLLRFFVLKNKLVAWFFKLFDLLLDVYHMLDTYTKIQSFWELE